jgi:uncharacterized membrane protein/sporulation protein YlmC with PRC-barrel domain
MARVPVSAKVECADGLCGESTGVVVNPVTRTITHYVVREDATSVERLVPAEQVVLSSSDLLRLRCTRAELANLPQFLQADYVPSEVSSRASSAYYRAWIMPLVTRGDVPDDIAITEAIPPGTLAVRRGARVAAVDGDVGTVTDLVVEPESGQISHFVVEQGPRGSRELTLPVSAVGSVAEGTVYLKLDKGEVGALPSIPIKRHLLPGTAEVERVELVARVYDDPGKASEALDLLRNAQREPPRSFTIREAAVLVKNPDGSTMVEDTGDVTPEQGRVVGAVTGGLLGLLGGPLGAVVGAAAGAGIGDITSRKIDRGFPGSFLERLEGHLRPNTSALVVLVEHQWAQPVTEMLRGHEGLVSGQALTDFLVQEMLTERGGA